MAEDTFADSSHSRFLGNSTGTAGICWWMLWKEPIGDWGFTVKNETGIDLSAEKKDTLLKSTPFSTILSFAKLIINKAG